MGRSTPLLSEAARHVVIPRGIKTTAWPRVVAQCAEMGVGFDPWQHGVGQVSLGKRADGKYAATVGGVVLSIPRQVGKTFLVGMIVIALCVLNPGMTVIWTAHRTRTATNTFRSLQGMAKRKKVFPHVSHIRTANGEQEIGFRNGSRIMFGAREQGFGRGFDEVDIEVFDEAQILTAKALEDMVAATNQSRQPAGALLFFMGTPPRPSDPGEEFTNRRTKALSGKAENMVYVEFSADRGADPDDREQWAKANPSFPSRTPAESMERMRENLTDDDSFMREALGVWDAEGSNRVIPAQSWLDAGDEFSFATERLALGVQVAPDLVRSSVCLAGLRDDGSWHIELDESREGTAWVGPYVEELLRANPLLRGVGVDAGSPSKAIIEERAPGDWFLRGTGVRVIRPTVSDLGAACAQLLAGVVAGTVRHNRQGQMSTAVSVASKRGLSSSSMWVWHPAGAVGDITPVQGATLALWVAQLDKIWKKPLKRRDGSQRRAVVL